MEKRKPKGATAGARRISGGESERLAGFSKDRSVVVGARLSRALEARLRRNGLVRRAAADNRRICRRQGVEVIDGEREAGEELPLTLCQEHAEFSARVCTPARIAAYQMSDLREKVVWITGASSGIGAELAFALASQEARLILSARRADLLADVKRRCSGDPGNVVVIPMDVTRTEAIPEMVREAMDAYGRIDILINNARGTAVRVCAGHRPGSSADDYGHKLLRTGVAHDRGRPVDGDAEVEGTGRRDHEYGRQSSVPPVIVILRFQARAPRILRLPAD